MYKVVVKKYNTEHCINECSDKRKAEEFKLSVENCYKLAGYETIIKEE